mgnify:CR=1 FL=1
MSSLAAARADNFYFPPEWSPSKGGLNKFQGQHALRERAKKIDQVRGDGSFGCGGALLSCHSHAGSTRVSTKTSYAHFGNLRVLPGDPGCSLRDALQRQLRGLQPHDRQRRALQRGEEGGRQILLHEDMGVPDEKVSSCI